MIQSQTLVGAVAGVAHQAFAALRDYTIHKLGMHRDAPRIFVEALRLSRAGFCPGARYSANVDTERRMLTLVLDAGGTYQVSRRGNTTPVLDLNSKQLLDIFAGHEAVRMVIQQDRIHFLPLASATAAEARLERVRNKLKSGEALTSAAICAGAGFMSEALARGYQAGGLNVTPALVSDIDATALEHGAQAIPAVAAASFSVAAPLQEVVQDAWLMRRLPKLDIVELSLPCSGASSAGKAKRGSAIAEQHPEVGHLIAPALMLLQALQPAVIVVENVPAYQSSGSAWILRHTLRDMGYTMDEVELDGKDFGALEARKRWFMVATTAGMCVPLSDLVPNLHGVQTVADILEAVSPDDPRWSDFAYLRQKEIRDKSKGNGFMMQVVRGTDTEVPTLRKGYHKGGSTDPLLAHPERPGLYRKFTASEHARAKGFDPALVAGLSETRGHELLGQAVLFAPLFAIGRRIAERLRDCVASTSAHKAQYSMRLATG